MLMTLYLILRMITLKEKNEIYKEIFTDIEYETLGSLSYKVLENGIDVEIKKNFMLWWRK